MKPRSYALIAAGVLVATGAVLTLAIGPQRRAPVAVVQSAERQPPGEKRAAAVPAKKPAVKPAVKPAAKPAPKPAAKPVVKPQPQAVEQPIAALPEQQPAGKPLISIESPIERSVYHSSVLLSGKVSDSAEGASVRLLDSVTWTLVGTGRTAEMPIGSNGAFKVAVPTAGLRAGLTLVVRAVNRDGEAAETTVPLVDDGKGPGIAVASPGPGSTYGSTVIVEGTLSGPSDAEDPIAEIASASWSVAGTDLGDELRFSRAGGFELDFSTIGLRGPLAVSIDAKDRNGHPSQLVLRLADRPTGPALAIDAPAEPATYNGAVSVEGRVGNPDDPSGTPAEVKSISWKVVGAPGLAGSVPFRNDGAFSFSFPTDKLAGTQVLELRAEDRNGRASTRAITLAPRTQAQPEAGQQPSLKLAAPEDGSFYGPTVTVTGTVTGTAAAGSGDPITSVSWSVAGSSLAGTVAPDKAGGFGFVVNTVGLHGTLALTVRVASKAGRAVERTIALMDDEAGLPIALLSTGGWYRESTVIEGRVGDAATASDLKSLSWEVVGKKGMNGRATTDPAGSFRLAVPFAELSGDVAVLLVAEDMNGHLSRVSVELHDGTIKPTIAIVSPENGGAYGSTLRVAGTVEDPYAGRVGMEGIESLAWLVSPLDFSASSKPARGAASLGTGNAFRIAVPTAGFSGALELTLTAVGRSGNRAEARIRLTQGESDVPGFTVSPADREVTVSWAAAPLAVRYDLAWAAGDTAPEQGRIVSTASSPVTVRGLDNGSRYSFRLQVVFDDDGTGVSGLIRAIPLSPQTLLPIVKPDYQQLRLSWNRVAGADAYDVWRSQSKDGAFAKLAAAVPAEQYVDSAVEFGRQYFYQIAPAGIRAPMSASASATPLAFPVEKLAALGTARLSDARRVTVQGGYAFIASGARGVRIVDVSVPEKPSAVGEIATTDAWGVAVRGNYAYVADGESGLRVLDISKPRAPEIVGSRKTTDARAVALAGAYAFVADGTKGLKVISIADARALPRVASIETENAQDVAVSGGTLFVADGPGGLLLMDITRPESPALVASLAVADARAVAVQSGLAVVAAGAKGLLVVDVSDPSKPSLLSAFDTGTATAVALDAGFAFVADGRTGIKVVDLEDPARPTLFTSHASEGATAVSVVERFAYIADSNGLDLMRVQIQGRSFRVASCETGKAFGVTVSGDWAYVAGHAQGVRVVDVRDPSKSGDGSLAGLAAARFALSVTIVDRLAYIADGSSGLRIVDVSPSWSAAGDSAAAPAGVALAEVGSYRPGGTVSRVAVRGTVAYLAAGDQGVRVLDVSNPGAPKELAALRTRNALDLVLKGDWLLVADGDGGVRVVDVSDPARPKALPDALPGNARALAMSQDLLVVAGAAGVRLVDVKDPARPVAKGRYETASAEAVAANDRYVFVAEGYRGLTVLDVSRPSRPAVVSTCEDVFAVGVAVKGDYALVADSFGLRVIRVLVPEWLMH